MSPTRGNWHHKQKNQKHIFMPWKIKHHLQILDCITSLNIESNMQTTLHCQNAEKASSELKLSTFGAAVPTGGSSEAVRLRAARDNDSTYCRACIYLGQKGRNANILDGARRPGWEFGLP